MKINQPHPCTSARMINLSSSGEFFYDSKELLELDQLGKNSDNIYDGLFELNLNNQTDGEPLLRKKKFKPVHCARGPADLPKVFNNHESGSFGPNSKNKDAPSKDQAAGALLEVQSKLSLIGEHMHTLDTKMRHLEMTMRQPEETEVRTTERFNNHLVTTCCLLAWPVVLHLALSKFAPMVKTLATG